MQTPGHPSWPPPLLLVMLMHTSYLEPRKSFVAGAFSSGLGFCCSWQLFNPLCIPVPAPENKKRAAGTEK